LHHACNRRNLDMVRLLLDGGANISGSVLVRMVTNAKYSLVITLNKRHTQGKSPLIIACLNNDEELVDLLLSRKDVDVNAPRWVSVISTRNFVQDISKNVISA
jgi:ankyrin repeat protein